MVLVTYEFSTVDTASQKRLRRVAKFCEDLGQWVQNSVFECLVDPAQWTRMKGMLVKEIDPERDSLRFYFLR